MRSIPIDLSQTECAYLAGLIDGEGCLNFYKTTNRSCSKGYTFVARMSITNCDAETLLGIRERLGLGQFQEKSDDGSNRKPAYVLTFYAREVRELLPHIMPYLRIKKRQAELVFGFLQRQRWGGQKGGLSQEEHDRRENEHQLLSQLNQRGRF